jgi:hypothetical protein
MTLYKNSKNGMEITFPRALSALFANSQFIKYVLLEKIQIQGLNMILSSYLQNRAMQKSALNAL